MAVRVLTCMNAKLASPHLIAPVIIDPLWLPADIEHITWPSTVATDLQKRWFAQR